MFYAEYTLNGVGTLTERKWQRSLGVTQSTGILVRFATRAERNAWVDDDNWDGNYHPVDLRRGPLTRKEAATLYHGAFHVSNWDTPQWISRKDGEPEAFVGRL